MAVDKKQMGLFIGLCVLFVIGIGVMFWGMFFKGDSPARAERRSVAVTIPDGEVKQMADSKAEAMRGAVTLDKYFDELMPEGAEEDMSLVSASASASASSEPASAGSPAPSAPASAVERVFGSAPSSASSPSASSSEAPGRRSSSSGGGYRPRPRSDEERLAYDRQRAEMVRDVLTGGAASASEEASVTEDAPEKSASIDLSAVGSSDDIISTLDDEPSEGVSYGLRPFRCMFVRDEKLKKGQRVSLRLLEDYTDGGVRIPANTHLQAICDIGDRLQLSVRSLELGGRIVPLALEAYDTDGLKGIYCPETSSSRASRKASDEAISTAGQTFGGLVGDIASTVLRTGASIAKSATGELSVSVVSGYEFYLVKSEKR